MIPDAEIRNPRFSKKSGSQKWPSFPFVVVEKLSVFGRSRVEPLSSLRTGDHNAEMDRALWSPARRLERGSTLDRPKTVNLSTTTKGKLSHFWPPDFLEKRGPKGLDPRSTKCSERVPLQDALSASNPSEDWI